jgi:hypothetical protein
MPFALIFGGIIVILIVIILKLFPDVYGLEMMCVILDYGIDSPAKALLLLALSMSDRKDQKEMDRIHIQKTIKYYEHMQQENSVDFSNFKHGGVSYEVQEVIETFEDYGLIENIGSSRNPIYVLTEEGEKGAKELTEKYSEEELRRLKFAKHQLNDLSFDETLYFMYKLIPETQRNSTQFERLEKKKHALITKLFLKGRINSDIASEWLGIDKQSFLDSLQKSC